MEKFLCPVCKMHEFEKQGDYEICPICRWENDKVQAKDFDFEGGANELSVNTLRAAFVKKKNMEILKASVK